MAHVVKIKNKKYVPASDAGKLFGYTSDYVARLAREGKIKGQRLGRQWLVDARSLEAFAKSTEVLQKQRNDNLRRERKEERISGTETVRQPSATPAVRPAVATATPTLAPAERLAFASHRMMGAGDLELKLRALLGASGVVFAGIVLGVVLHAGPSDTLSHARAVAAAVDAREMFVGAARGISAHANILGRTFTGVIAHSDTSFYGGASVASAAEDVWCGVTSFFGYTCARDYLVEGDEDTSVVENVLPATPSAPAPVRIVERVTTTLPVDPAPTYITNVTNPVTIIREEITNYTELTTRVLHDNQTDATHDSIESGLSAVSRDVSDRFTAIGEFFTTELLTVTGDATVLGNFTVGGITSTSTVTSYGVATAPYFSATSTSATSTFAGGFAVDTSGFVYDWQTGNVGVGTTSPSQKLSVSGNTYVDGDLSVSGTVSLIGLSLSSYLSAPRVVITDAVATSTFAGGLTIDTSGFVYDHNTGRVGIGTTTPDATLAVDGDLTVTGSVSLTGLSLSSYLSAPYIETTDAAATSTFAGGLVVATNGLVYDFATNRVGIGTTSPSQKFSVSGDGYFTGGFGIGIATTTAGVLQTSGDGWIGGNFTVVGNSTVFGNSTTLGETTADILTINSSINSNLVPDLNATRDLGSPSFYWDDVYVDTINANNISAASTTISGTQSADFTFNSDNGTMDTEDVNLIFYRGTVVPNALITWDSTRDRFDINQPFFIQNDSSTTTVVTLDVQGTEDQTSDLFRVRSFESSPYFSVSASGRIGVGTSTPATTFDIFGTDALRIPVGTTGQRPSDELVGQIRYNTTTAQFEGYGTSLVWQGLGGLIDADQDTYVTAEESADEDYLRFYTEGSERLTITDAGRFGIGTSTPAVTLDIYATDAVRLPVGTTAQRPVGDTGLIRYNTETTQFEGYSSGAWQGLGGVIDVDQDTYVTAEESADEDYLRFFTAGSERLTVTNTGMVGIGTTDPQARLQIASTTAGAREDVLILTNASGTVGTEVGLFFAPSTASGTLRGARISGVQEDGSNGIGLRFYTGLGAAIEERLRISRSGNVGIGDDTPDDLLNIHSSSANAGVAITSLGSDTDPYLGFQLVDGTNAFTMGVDDSDDDKFKISTTGLGTNDRFVIDASGNVGVGTSTPARMLSVGSDGTYSAYFAGRVGINKSTPSAALDISGGLLTSQGIAVGGTAHDATPSIRLYERSTNPGATAGSFGQIAFVDDGAITPYIGLYANGTTPRLVVNDSGNVGIGTTDPGTKLDVESTSAQLTLNSTASLYSRIVHEHNGTALWTAGTRSGDGGDYHIYRESGAGDVIVASGNVGIGTTTPNHKLSVTGTVELAGSNPILRYYETDAAVDAGIWQWSANGGAMRLQALTNAGSGGGDVIDITRSGSSILGMAFLDNGVTQNFISNAGDSYFTSGNVGIGTTTPGAQLHIAQDATYNSESTAGLWVSSATTPLKLIDFGYDTAVDAGFIQSLHSTFGYKNLLINPNGGNVGIGTVSPGSALEVTGSAELSLGLNVGFTSGTPVADRIAIGDGAFYLDYNSGNPLMAFDSNDYFAYNRTSNYFQFVSGGTERMRINSSGSVGIGTTTPGYKLDVWGTFRAHPTTNSNLEIQVPISLDDGVALRATNDAGSAYADIEVLASEFVINAAGGTGNVGIGTSSPEHLLSLERSTNGSARTVLRNPNSGTAALSMLQVSNGYAEADSGYLAAGGTGYTGVASWQDSLVLNANSGLSGGVKIRAAAGGIRLSASGTETSDLYVATSGNVGIGTVSPSADIDIERGDAADFELTATGAGGRSWLLQTANTAGYGSGGGRFRIFDSTGVAERFTIDTSGNIGIGTTTPGARLDIDGAAASWSTAGWGKSIELNSGNAIKWEDNGTTRWGIGQTTGGLYFINSDADDNSVAATYSMLISNAGNVGIGTVGPDTNLHVQGPFSLPSASGSTSSDTAFRITNASAGDTGAALDFGQYGATASWIQSRNAGNYATNYPLALNPNGGNIGIGTTNPYSKLHAAGGVGIGIGVGVSAVHGARNTMQILSDTYYGGSYDDHSGYLMYSTMPGGWGTATLNFAVSSGWGTYSTSTPTLSLAGTNVGIGTTAMSLFNAVGGTTKLAVTGSSASTNILGNTDASISIVNTDDTTDNTAGLHFAWQDTDGTPNYAGASIVTQLGAKVAGQYPSGSLHFLTSSATNNAPTEKLTILENGNVGIGTTSPDALLTVEGATAALTLRDTNGLSILRLENDTVNPAANTILASLAFVGNDSAGNSLSAGYARIFGRVLDGTDGSEDGALEFYTVSGGTAANRMTIGGASGYVGIGTTIPTSPLHVVGAQTMVVTNESTYTGGNTLFRNKNSAGALFDFRLNGPSDPGAPSEGQITLSTADPMTFFQAGIEKLRIHSNGNVGIGTTTPNSILSVRGGNAASGANQGTAQFGVTPGSSSAGVELGTFTGGYGMVQGFAWTTGGANALTLNPAGGNVLLVQNGGGNVGIGTTGPDRKLDILDASNPQLRLSQSDGSIYTDLQVAASTGDLTINLQPNTSAENLYLIQSGGTTGANLRVCEGSACPSVVINSGGNVLVENGYYFGNGYKIDQVAGTTTEIAVYDTAGAAILIFDEF